MSSQFLVFITGEPPLAGWVMLHVACELHTHNGRDLSPSAPLKRRGILARMGCGSNITSPTRQHQVKE